MLFQCVARGSNTANTSFNSNSDSLSARISDQNGLASHCNGILYVNIPIYLLQLSSSY